MHTKGAFEGRSSNDDLRLAAPNIFIRSVMQESFPIPNSVPNKKFGVPPAMSLQQSPNTSPRKVERESKGTVETLAITRYAYLFTRRQSNVLWSWRFGFSNPVGVFPAHAGTHRAHFQNLGFARLEDCPIVVFGQTR
jgi:hypothetical protein